MKKKTINKNAKVVKKKTTADPEEIVQPPQIDFDATYIKLREVFDIIDQQKDVDADELLESLEKISNLSWLLQESIISKIESHKND